MPGLKIIEIVLGLTFVYLLLSLLCTAINEYIAGMLNKRGRELFKAVDDLLGDDEVRAAFYRHPLITTLSPKHREIQNWVKTTQTWPWGTRWIRRFAGWLRPSIRSQRLPSYLPARNFALALLNSTDYAAANLGVQGASLASASPPTSSAGGAEVAQTPVDLVRLFDALMEESAADVSELLRDPAVAAILGSTAVPQTVRDTLTDISTGAERKLQKLQDAVEVWFNNAMDRVSGAYKRYTQIALLLIGFVVATLLNVDTIRIWQTLATNDELRESIVQRAIAFNTAARDTTQADTAQTAPATQSDTTLLGDTTQVVDTTLTAPPAGGATGRDTADCVAPEGEAAVAAFSKALAGQKLTCGEAKSVIATARAQLDSTELGLGWSRAELLEVGVVKVVADSSASDSLQRSAAGQAQAATPVKTKLKVVWWPLSWHGAMLPKLLGLILTAIAVSLGAPFWFDMLNKFINIRAAGRAPDERPKNPEARDKRLAGQAPR